MKQTCPRSKPFPASMVLVCFSLMMGGIVAPAQPSTVVVPTALTSNDVPFASWVMQVPNIHIQEVYAAAHFPNTGMLITELRFRPDSFYGLAFTSTVENIQFNLSTTIRSPDALNF